MMQNRVQLSLILDAAQSTIIVDKATVHINHFFYRNIFHYLDESLVNAALVALSLRILSINFSVVELLESFLVMLVGALEDLFVVFLSM